MGVGWQKGRGSSGRQGKGCASWLWSHRGHPGPEGEKGRRGGRCSFSVGEGPSDPVSRGCEGIAGEQGWYQWASQGGVRGQGCGESSFSHLLKWSWAWERGN